VLRGVVAQRVEVGVGEVGLEAEGVRHADAFEDVEHVLPGVHAGPADFTFGGEALAVVGGDLGGLLEGVDDAGGVRFGFSRHLATPNSAESMRMTPYLRTPCAVEDLRDAAGHLHGAEEFGLLGVVAHGGVAHGAGPHGGHEGADGKALGGDQIGDLLDLVIAGLGIRCGAGRGSSRCLRTSGRSRQRRR
jgi:hypothetical protein